MVQVAVALSPVVGVRSVGVEQLPTAAPPRVQVTVPVGICVDPVMVVVKVIAVPTVTDWLG